MKMDPIRQQWFHGANSTVYVPAMKTISRFVTLIICGVHEPN